MLNKTWFVAATWHAAKQKQLQRPSLPFRQDQLVIELIAISSVIIFQLAVPNANIFQLPFAIRVAGGLQIPEVFRVCTNKLMVRTCTLSCTCIHTCLAMSYLCFRSDDVMFLVLSSRIYPRFG